jgi:hypothetical protein
MIRHVGREPRPLFPPSPLPMHGDEIAGCLVPDDKRREVLKEMHPFVPLPPLDQEWIDIRTDKKFKVREFRVTREQGGNFLVSPYYEEGGGTVIDRRPLNEDDE